MASNLLSVSFNTAWSLTDSSSGSRFACSCNCAMNVVGTMLASILPTFGYQDFDQKFPNSILFKNEVNSAQYQTSPHVTFQLANYATDNQRIKFDPQNPNTPILTILENWECGRWIGTNNRLTSFNMQKQESLIQPQQHYLQDRMLTTLDHSLLPNAQLIFLVMWLLLPWL